MNINVLLWLIPVLFTIHNLEEALTMRKYGTEHFKKMQRGQFPAAVTILTLLVVVFIYFGTREEVGLVGRFLAIFGQASLFINALAHIIGTLRLRRYTPGLITAVLIYIPFSIYLFNIALQNNYITEKQLFFAFGAGIIMQIPLVLGALFIGKLLIRLLGTSKQT
ncbi:HXXEE domain-containing protein [Ectobacillus panaciterrae]|uniref:HXXEE domain-containing protein n=1 Tax=Ectobacillus panaciterrae TaxID=363872 RepID=UPI000423FC75|nr:HXXEE domain-containing protein [Ectobacillus panaciterrae]